MKPLSLLLALLLLTASAAAQPDEPDAAVQTLAADSAAFAFDLYRQAAAAEGNLLFSPYSVSSALAMAYAGARARTADQIAAALHFTLPPDQLHPAFAALSASLTARANQASGSAEGQRLQLNIANALWGQAGFPFRADYLALLETTYGAGLKVADFINQPEPARQAINDWVAEQTRDKIKNIVPPDAITPITRLVLVNAIYFNASWQTPFVPELTADAPFFLLDGSTVTVPMMNQSERLGYSAGAGYQAVALPYLGRDMSLIAVLPDEGRFAAFEETLDAALFARIVGDLRFRQVNLTLPRFSYETTLGLTDALKALGVTEAFSGAADFSGMAEEALFISEALHKAFIAVDESGTEAAAATALIFGATSAMPEEPVTLRLDRPFIYAIVDQATGSILFLGRVLNPA